MSDARTIRVESRDYRIDGRLMRRIWKLMKPYWTSPRHWRSWLLLGFGVAMGPVWAAYNFWIATQTSVQANHLIAHHEKEWIAFFWLFLGLGLGQWAYGVVLGILNKVMFIHWYEHLSAWMIDRYLEQRTYYDISMKDDIDNPDERIQDNVEPFVDIILNFPMQILGTGLSVITNAALLLYAQSNMVFFVVTYSLFTMGVQVVLYWPLIRKNFELVAANADFRYGVLRIRENAETIAFFRGERMERHQVASRLNRVVKAKMSVYYYSYAIQAITHILELAWSIAPLFFVYSLYFSGKIQFGTIALITGAAATLRQALANLSQYIPTLAAVAPRVIRLSQLVERAEAISSAVARHEGQIRIDRGDAIILEDVCFQTPGGEQQLAQHVSIEVSRGQSLIITGQTGVGKSSILRSMAGLWTQGSGRMIMPPQGDVMFVPQKPYMMLGNLRAQLLYPQGPETMSDTELQAVLERVHMPDLIAMSGGLSAERDWAKVLSLGEQQRISFARILISRPRYVFLDESTSAVDVPIEERLYRTLIENDVTFVSVGHRETILRFHERALRLYPEGAWEIVRAGDIPTTPVEPLGAAR